MGDNRSIPVQRAQKRRHTDAILNQWLHLGEVTWLTQMEGFSMLSDTEFGAFLPDDERSEQERWVEDPSVGLKIRTNGVRSCRLTGVPENGDILFRLGMESHAEIVVSKRRWEKEICPILNRIRKIFGLDGSDTAMPWLDEWEEVPESCRKCPLACYRAADQISKWREIMIHVETADLSIDTRFSLTWADRDDTVLRMYDCRRQMAIYVDLAVPGLSLSSSEDHAGHLYFLN
jgi:hypothetical protein